MPARFSRLSTEDGLANNYVNAILQDRRGRLWFGTQDGLCSYDGYEFTVFRHNSAEPRSIASSEVRSLVEDKEGRIWTGTLGGLSVFDPDSREAINFRHDPQRTDSLPGNNILLLFKDSRHTIWVSTMQGLARYNEGRFTKIEARERVTGIGELSDGRLFLAHERGVSVLEPGQTRVTPLRLHAEGIDLTNEELHRVLVDRRGQVWFGTRGKGVFRYDMTTNVAERFSFGSSETLVNDIQEADDGRVWVAFNGTGLLLFDPQTRESVRLLPEPGEQEGLSSRVIKKIFRDRNGLLWISAEPFGLHVYSPYRNKFSLYRANPNKENALSSNFVRGITERGKHLWIATQGGGLNRYDRAKDEWRVYRHDPKNPKSLPSNNVSSLLQASNGHLYVATISGGFCRYEEATESFKRYSKDTTDSRGISDHRAYALLEAKDGSIWIGSYVGLHRYDPAQERFTNYPYYGGEHSDAYCDVQALYEERDGTLLVGTSRLGLLVFDPKSGVYKHGYRHSESQPESLSNDFVTHISRDRGGRLLITTKGGGLNIATGPGRFRRVRKSDGLPHDNTYACIEDDAGYYWISTDLGLCRYNPTDGSVRNYSKVDGLQGNEFNRYAYYKSSTGELFFGGVDGLCSFLPARIQENRNPPATLFTKLRKFNKIVSLNPDISARDLIRLEPYESFFSVEFAGLDYSAPAYNTYYYMLVGFHEDWIATDASQRSATFTNLLPGRYLLRVRSCNPDGYCDPVGEALNIHILPPWWMTWWAVSLFFISFIAMGYTGYRARVRSLHRRNSELKQAVDERTREVVKQRDEILWQRNRIEDQQVQILDSIRYAERIQQSFLPHTEELRSAFPDSFILFKPKDIVSGDFYWFHSTDTRKYIAVVDCTGHGVPGALISMVGEMLLNQIVVERSVSDPALVLEEMHERVNRLLRQDDVGASQDGMDVALCVIDADRVLFAGARRPLFYVGKDGRVVEIKGNRRTIGGRRKQAQAFSSQEFPLAECRTLLLTTDGLTDQPGPTGKFGKKRLIELLEQSTLTMESLERALKSHQEHEPQRDDITVICVSSFR